MPAFYSLLFATTVAAYMPARVLPARRVHVRLCTDETPSENDWDMGLLKYAPVLPPKPPTCTLPSFAIFFSCAADAVRFLCILRRMPRLTTPERASYERFRKRQEDRTQFYRGDMNAMADEEGGKKVTPLGLDPVEGEPVDLREVFRTDGTIEPPSPVDEAQANAQAEAMLRNDMPDGFGDDLEQFF